MSRRDLRHVLLALRDLSGGDPTVGVSVAEIAEAIGRTHIDMRTPLNLQSLRAEGQVVQLNDDSWALTPKSVEWLEEDLRGGG